MLNLNGTLYNVPGVYGTIEIVQVGTVNLPLFNTLIFIGSARSGIPFNASGKTGADVIKAFSDVTSVRNYYGGGDLANAYAYAKSAGAGLAFFINAASLTLASATIKDNQGSPAASFDVSPADQFYGASGNDIALTIATASSVTTITITPPKLTKFLTANASTSSPYISLEDVDGLAVGQTVKVTSNGASGAPDSTTIVSIDTVNKQITLADNPGTAWATSDYARIYQEDTDKAQIGTFTSSSTVNDVINWINSGNILVASRGSHTGIVPTSLSKIQLQLIASATLGTSPVATTTTGGDYDTLASDFPSLSEQFANVNQIRPRILTLLTSVAAVHSVYRALALTMRNNQQSIKIITGAALTDVAQATTDSAHPIQRTKVLNSQDVVLASMGLDGIAPYLSLAPYFAGLKAANSVAHNATNDAVVGSSKVEKFFGESNKQSETSVYLASGCLIVGTGKNGFYIIQDINTYQNQATIWNTSDKASYLNMQVDIVDFCFESYRNQMNEGVGADGYGPSVARVQAKAILDELLQAGYITDWKILSATQVGNAVITEPEIVPVQGVDFVGFTLKVLIDN